MKRAVFIGWQEDVHPYPNFALFNVLTDDKKYPHGTTVDANSLVEWGIRVPIFPDYVSWKMTRFASAEATATDNKPRPNSKQEKQP